MKDDFYWPDFERMLTELFSPENESADEQQAQLLRFAEKVAELSSMWEERLSAEVNENNNLILDLEHIVAVGSDRITMKELPEELRDLSQEEYLEKLGDIVKQRRGQKDLAAIYRTFSQRCGNIVNFISGMANRKYEIRYKNPKFANQPNNQGVPSKTIPVERESDIPGATTVNTHVPIKRDTNPKNSSAGYASRNYPH